VKILLIRLRLIGDVVFTTPMLRALKRAYPDATLSYLVEPPAEAVVRGNPYLDSVIVAPQATGVSRIATDFGLARRLRRERYDLVIDLHGGPRSAWLTWFSGAPQRIGYEITGRTWMYTRAVPRPRALRSRHSVLNQWDLLEAIDGWSSIRHAIRCKWHLTLWRTRGSGGGSTNTASPRRMNSSSFTSARATRSDDGRSRRSPVWFRAWLANRRAGGSS
jgi:heptosyltransferase II